MRILEVMQHLYLGGGEKFVVELARNLAHRRDASGRRAHDVTLYVVDDNPEALGRATLLATIDPAVTLVLGPRPRRPGRRWRRRAYKLDERRRAHFGNRSLAQHLIALPLARFLHRNRFDVVHSNWFEPDNFARCALRLLPVLAGPSFRRAVRQRPAKVVTDHGGYHTSFPVYERLHLLDCVRAAIRDTVRSTDRLVTIAPSQGGCWDEENARCGASMPHGLIPNGVPLAADRVVTKARLGFAPDDFVIGHAARGVPEKGLAELIAAFGANDAPGARLLVLGAGGEIDRLAALHRDDARIRFEGAAANVNDYYAAMDLFALPTRAPSETLPNVVSGALGHGVPVVVTEIGDTRWQLTDPDTGGLGGRLLRRVDGAPDVAELRAALLDFQTSPDLHARCAANARGAARRFDMDRCGDAYLDAFRAAIATQEARRRRVGERRGRRLPGVREIRAG